MESHLYEEMAEYQDSHWWFRARREIIREEINRLNLRSGARILEIGCGPGGNLGMLQEFGTVSAIEKNDFARNVARSRYSIDVRPGWLPENIPFHGDTFDLICLFDVLEHVKKDMDALMTMKKILKPGGRILMTVPAYPWMFSTHDVMLHHYRRYTWKQFVRMLELDCHYSVLRITYYNCLLFPLLMAARFIDIFRSSDTALGADEPNKLLNFVLYSIFRLERRLLKWMTFPFGASMIVVVSAQE